MSNPSELPALAELGERLEAARQARRRKPSNPLLRPAWLVPAVLVAMVGLAFTPPGRTLTGEVGELVGIGEVGGPPTQPSKVGDFDPATGQVILAVGEAADGAQFEIVAYRAKQDATCVNVEFLDAPPDRAGVCYSGALNYGAMCCPSMSFPDSESDSPTTAPFVEGQVSPRVNDVTVSYVDTDGEKRTVDATLGMITQKIAGRLGIEHPSGLFFASLPGLETQAGNRPAPAGRVVMAAYGAQGERLESETIRLP